MTVGPGRFPARPRTASTRVGDSIARVLRERILNNEFADGLLPKQEDLMGEFGVSAPSVREAFRILEAEGLITVRRGNVGGAVVHVPDATSTAHALGLALQSDAVTLSDVSEALCALDALAVAACTRRADRAEHVVPRLLARVAEADTEINSKHWWELSLRFHEDLADLSGNGTFRLLIRSLLALWRAHADEWMTVLGFEEYVSRARRQEMTASHRGMISLIAAGDVEAARAAAEEHLHAAHGTMLQRPDLTISVTRIGNGRTKAT